MLLAYVIEEEGKDAKARAVPDRPELRVVTMQNQEVSSDALSIRGYDKYM